MSKSDIEFKLIDISSSYDPESDYFTLQADMKPLSYENTFILSSKIISYQDDVLINTSENTLMLFENEDDVCGIYDGISDNGNNNPNKFDVIYKIFSLIEKNTLNLKLPGPPELSRKGGSFIVHQPERNFIGSNKWKFGSISIESIVIRQLEDSYEMYFNLENKDFLSSIPVIEIKGKNWTQRTEPILAENSKFQISLNIYEEIESLDFDFKFMRFEATKSDKLNDQIVPEPEIEETNNDNEEFVEDVKEIIVGNTYDVSAYTRNSFTEITQFENKKTKKTLNVETMWKGGNFIITIKNDEEREELQNCIGDDGDVFDYERYEDIELEDYFDDKGSEFIYWNSCGIDEKEQEQLEDEFQNSSSHTRQDFLEEKGFDSLFTNYQIHGGLIVNQVGESPNEENLDKEEDNQDETKDKNDLQEEDDKISSQDIQKSKESESQLKFIINELSSEIDEESYLNFSCDIEAQNLSEQKFFCEYQLILLQGEDKNTPLSNCNVIHTERSENCLLNQSNNQLYLSCSVKINETFTPNKFILRYRIFEEVGSFKFSPKLPNKKEPFVLNLPDKSNDGENKWGSKGIEIKSMRIKIDDGDRHNDSYFNFNYNLTCNKLNSFGLNFSWMTSSFPDESDDFEILQHEYSTFSGNPVISKDVKVLCRIFQASEWKEYSDNNIFTTDS